MANTYFTHHDLTQPSEGDIDSMEQMSNDLGGGEDSAMPRHEPYLDDREEFDRRREEILGLHAEPYLGGGEQFGRRREVEFGLHAASRNYHGVLEGFDAAYDRFSADPETFEGFEEYTEMHRDGDDEEDMDAESWSGFSSPANRDASDVRAAAAAAEDDDGDATVAADTPPPTLDRATEALETLRLELQASRKQIRRLIALNTAKDAVIENLKAGDEDMEEQLMVAEEKVEMQEIQLDAMRGEARKPMDDLVGLGLEVQELRGKNESVVKMAADVVAVAEKGGFMELGKAIGKLKELLEQEGG